MPLYSWYYVIVCRDGGYGSLLCGMEVFVEAVCWSVAMPAVGGSNSRVAVWRPHFIVSIYFIWHLILVRVIVWLEYSARCVLGGVSSCCPSHQPGGTSVPFACLRCSPLYTMIGIDTFYCMGYMFRVLVTTPHLWSCFACVWGVVLQLGVCLQSCMCGIEYLILYLSTFYFIFIVYVCLCVVVCYLCVSVRVLVRCMCPFFLVDIQVSVSWCL